MKLIKVAVSGASGQVGYNLLFYLSCGQVFGPNTRVALRLLDVPAAMKSLEGVAMELEDSSSPWLDSVVITDDPRIAFEGVNWALLIGAKPRHKGMERRDLIQVNGPIFVEHGRVLAARAASNLRVLVVGNPANTNCLLAAHHAHGIPHNRFMALTFLDHNRARAQLALKANVSVAEVTNMTIWGNHSSTQYPDAENVKIGERPAYEIITDQHWLRHDFITAVQERGAAIIAKRGHSSVGSAARAITDHIQSIINKTPAGHWFSAAVPTDGSYGVERGLVCSFPVVSDGQNYNIVQNLKMSDWAKTRFQITLEELRAEKEMVADLLKKADLGNLWKLPTPALCNS